VLAIAAETLEQMLQIVLQIRCLDGESTRHLAQAVTVPLQQFN
jgi:hypothetical protein